MTFRLADSLPKSAMEALRDAYDAFLRDHGIEPEDVERGGGRERNRERYLALGADVRAGFERDCATRLNRFLDAGHGACELAQTRCALALRGCLLRFDGIKVDVGDFVIMPNHVHALLTPLGEASLEGLLRGMKGAAAREIHQVTGGRGRLWQRSSFDHLLRSAASLQKFQSYIAENPQKAGLAVPPECVRSREYVMV